VAYGDHKFLDDFKTWCGNSSMSDAEMQAHADDWFVKASPYERRSTLLSLKNILEEDISRSELRQRAPLLNMYRRLNTYDQNLHRLKK
jgi:hypothetical protein